MAVSPHPSRLCEEILGQLLHGLEGLDHATVARKIIGHFGSLKAALSAPAIAQMRACGDLRAVRIMRAVRRATFWMQRRDLDERISLANPSCAFDYLHLSLGMESREQVRLLLLDGRQRLIRDDLVSQGGVDSAELNVRDVIVRGLEAGASALILVHNHPSGGTTPSRADIEITRRIQQGAKAVEIAVADHVIVTRSGCSSFRALGLL